MVKKIKIDNNIFFAQVEELLKQGECVKINIKGDSMHPALREQRDMVILSPASSNTLYVGNIALFIYEGQYTLHRLIKEDGEFLVFQGDNLNSKTELIEKSKVIAHVAKIVKDNRTYIDCFSRTQLVKAYIYVLFLRLYHTFKSVIHWFVIRK